jgi:hypothetical protein
VAKNESPQSRFKETAMKETRRDVSRNAELSSLQDDNPNAAGLGFLLFNPSINANCAGLKRNGAKEPVFGRSLRQCSAKYRKSERKRAARSPSFSNISSQLIVRRKHAMADRRKSAR